MRSLLIGLLVEFEWRNIYCRNSSPRFDVKNPQHDQTRSLNAPTNEQQDATSALNEAHDERRRIQHSLMGGGMKNEEHRRLAAILQI